MPAAVDGRQAGGGQARGALDIRQLDGVVSVAFLLAGLLRVVSVPLLEVSFVAALLNEVRGPAVEVGINHIRRHLLPLEAEVGVDCQIQLVQPADAQSAYVHLVSSMITTYLCFVGASSQLSGKFLPGRGHAGHSTAQLPCGMKEAPLGTFPRPPRFSIFKWRHWRIMWRKEGYRSCGGRIRGVHITNHERLTLGGRVPVLSDFRARVK